MTKAATLWIKSQEAGAKVERNARKLAWMDATRRMGDLVAHCEPQLARYEAEARTAAKAFAEAVKGKSTAEIVAIIAGAAA